MKFYIVSEDELNQLTHTAHYCGYQHALEPGTDEGQQEFLEVEAACRQRPVPDWATRFAERVRVGETSLDEGEYEIHNIQEIAR